MRCVLFLWVLGLDGNSLRLVAADERERFLKELFKDPGSADGCPVGFAKAVLASLAPHLIDSLSKSH